MATLLACAKGQSRSFRVSLRPVQVLFHDGKFQWKRLRNLIALAKEGAGGLDLSDTVSDGARVLLLDAKLRTQLLLALTEDNRLHLRVRLPVRFRLR